MKRLHVHVAVENLPASVRFYAELFAAERMPSTPMATEREALAISASWKRRPPADLAGSAPELGSRW